MNLLDELRGVLAEILHLGLLRIRHFGFAGDSAACAAEADHLHNLPALILTLQWDLLLYYQNVEIPAFKSAKPAHAEAFQPLWIKLGQLLENSDSGDQRV